MPVNLTLDDGSPADLLRDLRIWLLDEPDLRGTVHLRERAPEPGALGPVVDALQLALGSGGALATAATVIIAWLRAQRGSITIKLSRGDKPSLKVSATGVKNLNAQDTKELTEQLIRALDDRTTEL
ncbi:effector-associated constant component EACC1 [Nonomuraea sp. CA-143628]|uniref:effector-associated constant component EACC1 n=1 Tax=Nonomuraea sp. CA-143628 TaxID=3239997 RepID=UPI003D937003